MNVKNRTIFTDKRGFFTRGGRARSREDIRKVVDNLLFLRGMDSECVDLIYLDPPFNSKTKYNEPLGDGGGRRAVFNDTWRMDMVKEEWRKKIAVMHPRLAKVLDAAGEAGHRSDRPYLIYMAIRLLEMRRVLKPSGSVYLHCDPTMSHWLKLLMDCVFGMDNFRNEIVWSYRTGGVSKRHWPRKHDVLLHYGKDGARTFHNPPRERVRYQKNFFGAKKDADGYYADVYVRDVWDDIPAVINLSKHRTGYPTQKPLALLERIILASSNPGDVVLDPFCGCATACIAAEKHGRRWIGMDVSPVAFDMVKLRLAKDLQITIKGARQHGEQEILRLQKEQADGSVDKWEAHHRMIPPQRTDGLLLDLKSAPARAEVRVRLYAIQSGHCNGCGQHFGAANLNIDHITPKAFGGLDVPTNLQLLCGACNSGKGTKTMEEYLARRAKQGLPCREAPDAEYRAKLEWESRLENQTESGVL